MNVQTWQQVEALFHEALEQPPEAREAFLAQACGADAALRAEVISLLAADGHAVSVAEFMPALMVDWADASHPLIGKTIGRYQIQSLLGAGGMGEVFLAEDTQLGRRAALKLLPARFTADAGRIRRFEQEARAVLSLNHPNIVTLFDLGQADGAFFMATEYVEGETLRARLQREGVLSARAAIDLALQIAAALTAAHAAGIIHRDIKPENVMIRRDGYVKVLDFGLAKIAETGVDDTDSAEQSSLTESGAVMGTARYMSPEQARGLRLDNRTDLFSLAVVLYEMLAGRAPFTGETRGDLLVAILTAAPAPLVETAPSTPAVIEAILHKALSKEADARYASVAEFAEALKAIAAELAFTSRDAQALPLVSAPLVKVTPTNRFSQKHGLIAATAVLALAGAVGWLVYDKVRPRVDIERLKFTLVTSWQSEPEQGQLLISPSPDGKLVAFSRAQAGQMDIYVKQITGGEPRNITNDAWVDYSPIWSPDGERLAYVSVREEKIEIWLTPYFGGSGRLVKTLDQRPLWLTTWSRDGARLYYEAGQNLFAVDVATGEARQVTAFAKDSLKNEFAVSPDEQWLAYEDRVGEIFHLFVSPLAGGEALQITHEGEGNQTALWLPDNERLIYSSKRNGIQQLCLGFRDASKPVQLTVADKNMTPWDVSADGHRIFYFTSHEEITPVLLDVRTRQERRLSSETRPQMFPQFSPDGQSLVYQQRAGNSSDFETAIFSQAISPDKEAKPLTDSGFDPRWSPRGDQIAYLRKTGNNYLLWTARADGAEARPLVKEPVLFAGFMARPLGWALSANYAWSPEGDRLVFSARRNEITNLYSIAPDGTGEFQLTQNTDKQIRMEGPLWSPNGKRLAFLGIQRSNGRWVSTVYWADFAATMLQPQSLWHIEQPVRLLGWSFDDQQLLVGSIKGPRLDPATDVSVWVLSKAHRLPAPLAQFGNTFLHTVVLAPGGKQVAYVARQDNVDNIWLASLETSHRQRLTANNDPNVSLGGLVWAPQRNALCFTKQTNASSIMMIENFQ